MIPFFVADRPMSLRIIKGLPLQDYPEAQIGIMAHANTTANFQMALHDYPCDNFDFCDAIGGPCPYREDIKQCPERQRILARTIKMCDSGIFTREGATLTYEELFNTYDRMGVDYGIMIDVFRDTNATIESARESLEVYQICPRQFKLVVVAQGETFEDYIRCYENLKELGFEHIAIGGLLQKVQGTARYTQVRDETFMYEVLEELRDRYPEDWLFALGCYHPNRQKRFKDLNVWGDYKGWIFQYKKRNHTLEKVLDTLTGNHFEHIEDSTLQKAVNNIRLKVQKRAKTVEELKNKNKRLNSGRTSLKRALRELHQELLNAQSTLASEFERVTSRGLPKPKDKKLILAALLQLEKQDSEEASEIWENIESNRTTKGQIETIEISLEKANKSVASAIDELLNAAGERLSGSVVEYCRFVTSIIRESEQDYRLEQVRNEISHKILAK